MVGIVRQLPAVVGVRTYRNLIFVGVRIGLGTVKAGDVGVAPLESAQHVVKRPILHGSEGMRLGGDVSNL